MANVLVASLGESPVVVTAMYDLLKEKINVDEVMVLRPDGDDVLLGYELINEGLQGKCTLGYVPLSFVDANGEGESYLFLHTLFQHLAVYQRKGDTVYLSLAGGRKNMSALMALVVPFFPCVKKLYQVLDADEHKPGHQFKSIEELIYLPDAAQKTALFPPHEKLILVDIPYGEQQRVSEHFLAQLYTLDDEQLNQLWDKNPAQAEAAEFGRLLTGGNITGRMLDVLVTQHVKDDYARMCKEDAFHARRFAACFEKMRYADKYDDPLTRHGYIQHGSLLFHYYKRPNSAERPFYHTEPEGIHRYPHSNVQRVIISGLAIERENKYEPDEKTLLKLPLEPVYSVQTLFAQKTLLMVPLGTTPMVATQLYTLLKNEGRIISKVIIIYPGRSREVRNSAELVKNAFDYEQLPDIIRDEPIKNLKDIASPSDCELYRQTLEAIIDDVLDHYPDCEIVLSLSGGRKSMAALTVFSAQRKRLRYVYHTLIKDPVLSDTIERQTEVSELQPDKISKQERNNRLFLRSYKAEQDQFILFKVPVVPSGVLSTYQ